MTMRFGFLLANQHNETSQTQISKANA